MFDKRILLLLLTLVIAGPVSAAGEKACDIRKAQSALKRMGIDPGPIDGIWGNATSLALAKFQSRKKLSQTKELDVVTCQALQIPIIASLDSQTSGKQVGIPWSRIPDCKFLSERSLKNKLLVANGSGTSLEPGAWLKFAEGIVRGGLYDVMGVGTYIRFEEPTQLCGITFVSGGFTVNKNGIEPEPGASVRMQQ